MLPQYRQLLICVVLLFGASGKGSRADVLILKSGGQLHGEWLNQNRSPGESYLVQTEQGGTVRLDANQVDEVVRRNPHQRDYDRLVLRLPNSVPDHWRAAEWCRTHQLSEERSHHLQRILKLEPNHVAARRGLGYVQLHGKWARPAEFQEEHGYVLYRGRYRTQQEVELIKARDKDDAERREWHVRLRRWCEDMASADRAGEAMARIRAIDDPQATDAIRSALASERQRMTKLLLIDTLVRIHTSVATDVLVERSLHDPDQEIVYACVSRLTKQTTPKVISAYVEGLRHENNVVVNRAAYALGQLGDRSVLSPLIEALVTRHQLTSPAVRPASAATTTASFSRGNGGDATPFGGTGLAMGDGSQVSIVQMSNQSVLDALVRLSRGTSFGFEQRSWRAWLAVEQKNNVTQQIR